MRSQGSRPWASIWNAVGGLKRGTPLAFITWNLKAFVSSVETRLFRQIVEFRVQCSSRHAKKSNVSSTKESEKKRFASGKIGEFYLRALRALRGVFPDF